MRHPRRSTSLQSLAAIFLALAMLSAGAQTAPENPQSISISLLAPQQMSSRHASVAGAMQDAVARSAGIYGYTLDSSFDYREIACPFVPHDVLLAYESVSPSGAISRFTAVLSPGGSGGHSPVQIIPILHFGVTPFVPAYSSPHSIEIFNQAVDTAPVGSAALAEIQVGRAPIVLRGLCYLAMIGAEPSALRSPSLEAATFQAPVPTLQILENGRTRQLISIRNSPMTYQVWTLTFSSGGRLLATSREEHQADRQVLIEAATPTAPPSMTAPPVAAASSAPASTPPTPQPAVVAPLAVSAPSAAVVSPVFQPVPVAAPSTPISPPAAVAESPAPQPASAAVSAPAAVAVSPVSHPVPLAVPPPASASAVIPESPMAQPALPAKDGIVASAAPAATAVVAPPAPVAPAMVAPPPPARPSVPAMNSYRATQPALPEPPHRFIPDPPMPPRRFIPTSALPNPPHLPQ
jgi:hypothetical protein